MTISLVGGGADGRDRGARTVVALLLTHRGRLCLLRRSGLVGSDAGRWHCVTGFLDTGSAPDEHVLIELTEETGLGVADLEWWRRAADLVLPDGRGDGSWRVIVYRAEARHDQVVLNWEHDAVRWLPWTSARADRALVGWLGDLVRATDLATSAAA